jgi:hypothetical protein
MSLFYKGLLRARLPPLGGPCGPPAVRRSAAVARRPRGGRHRAAVRTGAGPRLRKRGLGCPTGAARLAGTGLDNVAKALERAQGRIRDAGVKMSLLLGDVTRLHESDLGSGYRLVLDTGTFHGLTREERVAMGHEVSAVASSDATLLLDCFAPGRRGPLPRGCTRADVEEAFPGWVITDAVIADSDPDPIARALRFDELFYRLKRR